MRAGSRWAVGARAARPRCGWMVGGKREGGSYKNLSNAAARTRAAWRREGCLHGKPRKLLRGQERAWGADGGRQLGQPGTTLRGAPPERAADGKRMGRGRDFSHKGHKGHRGKATEGKREGAGKALGARASRPRGNGWMAGGKKKTNRTKGDKWPPYSSPFSTKL